jgi:hypothetical protein
MPSQGRPGPDQSRIMKNRCGRNRVKNLGANKNIRKGAVFAWGSSCGRYRVKNLRSKQQKYIKWAAFTRWSGCGRNRVKNPIIANNVL